MEAGRAKLHAGTLSDLLEHWCTHKEPFPPIVTMHVSTPPAGPSRLRAPDAEVKAAPEKPIGIVGGIEARTAERVRDNPVGLLGRRNPRALAAA